MKRCPECQRGYGDEIFYCLSDGAYLSSEQPPATLPVIHLAETAPTKTAPASRVKAIILSAVITLIVSIGIVAFILKQPGSTTATNNSPSPSQTPSAMPSAATPTPVSTPTPASSPSKPSDGSTAIVSYRGDDGVNVRSGPSQTAKILTVVYYKERVTIVKYADDWTEVETYSGIVGYVRSKFLSF